MNLLFRGKTLNECLMEAEKTTKIPKDNLNYSILKKSNFFNKEFLIEVDASSVSHVKANSGNGIKVEQGQIIIEEENLDQCSLSIRPCFGIKLFINDILCEENKLYHVSKLYDIHYESVVTPASRNFNITISEDSMKVYLSIRYTPEFTYILKDAALTKSLTLQTYMKQGKYPNKYCLDDIKDELSKLKIKYGINESEIQKACEGNSVDNILICQGKEAIDDTDDEIKVYFDTTEEIHLKNKLDSMKDKMRIDYKNISSITSVHTDDLIGEKIPGVIGEDGINVYGKTIKKHSLKPLSIRCGKGCQIDGNKIFATMNGRPNIQNNIFSVSKVYSVQSINSSTGNINFQGDVEINGNVYDDIEVHSESCVSVSKNVTNAKIIASNNIVIKGNSIGATLSAGGIDLEKKIYLDTLNKYNTTLYQLIKSLDTAVMKYPNRKLGSLIKVLIENKFPEIPKMSMEILACNLKQGIHNSQILDFIRYKIAGLNSFNVTDISELRIFKNIIDEEFKNVDNSMYLPADITVDYCQNSSLKATGNITITGKGEYTSKIRAFGDITFTSSDAIARGGWLEAKNLHLKSVGSLAGSRTVLQVDADGKIEADVVFHNTLFIIDNKKLLLDSPCRNLKAYLDKDNQIAIEKLNY